MPTMKVQVTIDLTPEQVAWFVREADCIGCTFQEAVDIHSNEAMQELVAKYRPNTDKVVAHQSAN